MPRYIRTLQPLKVYDGANYTAYAKGELYLVDDQLAAELVAGGVAVIDPDHAAAPPAADADAENVTEIEENHRDPLAD